MKTLNAQITLGILLLVPASTFAATYTEGLINVARNALFHIRNPAVSTARQPDRRQLPGPQR